MSGVLVSLRVDVSPVQAMLDRVAAAGRDMAPAMRQVGELVLESVKRNFDQERSPEGEPWKKSKRVLRHGGQTLQLTRDLFNSLNAVPGPSSVEVGTPAEYGAIHQLGGPIKRAARSQTVHFKTFKSGPRKGRTRFSTARQATHGMRVRIGEGVITMPARPYLGVREEDWPRIEAVLARHLTGGANGQP